MQKHVFYFLLVHAQNSVGVVFPQYDDFQNLFMANSRSTSNEFSRNDTDQIRTISLLCEVTFFIGNIQLNRGRLQNMS